MPVDEQQRVDVHRHPDHPRRLDDLQVPDGRDCLLEGPSECDDRPRRCSRLARTANVIGPITIAITDTSQCPQRSSDTRPLQRPPMHLANSTVSLLGSRGAYVERRHLGPRSRRIRRIVLTADASGAKFSDGNRRTIAKRLQGPPLPTPSARWLSFPARSTRVPRRRPGLRLGATQSLASANLASTMRHRVVRRVSLTSRPSTMT